MEHFTDTVMYEIELTSRYIKHMGGRLFSQLGFKITPEEYTALDTINVYQNICQRDLAKLILKDRATTGRLVESLEKKGLISRSVDTKNNRLVRKLSVTKKGLDNVQSITKDIQKKLEKISKVISEVEIENLKNGIRTFRAGLEKLIELKI